MRQYKKNDDAVSPVIAVILMVAITVVLAGVVFVWAMTFANQDTSTTDIWQVEIKDASAALSSPTVEGDVVLAIEQNGGDPIDWRNVEVKVKLRNSDITYDLGADEIQGAAYSAATNYETEPGDIITFDIPTGSTLDGTLAGGDYIDVTILENGEEVATKTDLKVN